MPALVLDIQQLHSDRGLKFTVQIIEQKLMGGKACFIASNGFYFQSLSCPSLGMCYNKTDSNATPMLYLRGSSPRTDNAILETSSIGYIEKLKVAVEEYNIHYEDEDEDVV